MEQVLNCRLLHAIHFCAFSVLSTTQTVEQTDEYPMLDNTEKSEDGWNVSQVIDFTLDGNPNYVQRCDRDYRIDGVDIAN